MLTLFSNDDLRRLAGGVSIACAAGLLLGGAMRPDLDQHEAAGPRILMGESGARKELAAFDPGVAAYQGALPEYVIGTDWTRPREVAVAEPEPLPEDTGETVVYEAPTVEMADAAYVEEPRLDPLYPSMRGNAYYEGDLPRPPAPPADMDSELVVIGG